MKLDRWQADALLLLAACLWGMSNVLQKGLLQDLPPLTLVGLRCCIAAMVTLPFLRDEAKTSDLSAMAVARMSLPIATLFTLAAISQQFAFSTLSVTNGSFLITTTAVMTPIAAWILCREKPSAKILLALAIMLPGTLLISGPGFLTLNPGDILILISAALFAFWCVLLGKAVTKTRRPVAITAVQFLVCGILSTAGGITTEPQNVSNFLSALPGLLLLGGVGTGLAFFLQSFAQQYTPPNEAALLTGAESLFGMLGGMVFMNEQPSLAEGSGGCLILLAIALVQIQAVPRLLQREAVFAKFKVRSEPS